MAIGEWLLGYAAGKIGDKVLRALRGDVLMRDFEAAIDQWRERLPKEARLDSSAALFPSIKFEAELEMRPALKALRQEMSGARVPGHDIWMEALIEQWRQVKNTIPDPQLFFTIAEEDVLAHLASLSSKFVDICAQHERLFRPTVLALLLDFQAQIESLRATVSLKAAADNLPLTALAIEWTNCLYQIKPLWGRAMDNDLPWPGTYSSLTDDEFRYYRLLKSLLAEIEPTGGKVVAGMEALRGEETLDTAWYEQREALIAAISRLEGAAKKRSA